MKKSLIRDNNAYLRFKRKIRELIQEQNSPEYWHFVGKHPGADDTIVIRGQEWQGTYFLMAPVKNAVPELLRAAGIVFTETRIRALFGSQAIASISVSIDQEACPRPGRGKRSAIA